MRKLTDYVEMAAMEYLQETGKEVLDALWLAEFFQDGGVMDDFPRQDLVGFYALVQKALTVRIEKAEKLARLQQNKSSIPAKR
jgi:energy-converting hydrogenase A subunit M